MLTVTRHDNYFEITLNRPEKRNAITLEMIRQLSAAVAEAERDSSTRLIVIRGEGKAFSSGLDLQAIWNVAEEFGPKWQQNPHALTREWQSGLNRLAHSSIPSLALIHGYCLGLGLEIALACDFRYATEDAVLSLEETRLGLIPDVGGTTRLVKAIGIPRAKELILTARRIDAETAERWGLINRIVPKTAFDDAATQLTESISACAPLAVAAAKRVINGIADEASGLLLEQTEQAPLFRTADLQEGIQATLEKRPPEWKSQ